MGSLSEYMEKNPTVQSVETSSSNYENFAMNVTAYDGDFFVGERIDSKEEVRVRLREVEQKGRYSRPEVSDFADPKSRSYTEPGKGVVQFDYATLEKDGTYTARWANRLSRGPEESEVFVMMTRLKYGKNQNGDEWIQANILMTDYAKAVSSLDEVKSALRTFLTPKTPGSQPFAVIRISDDTTSQCAYVYPERVEGSNGYKQSADSDVSVESFFANSPKANLVLDLVGNTDLVMEVIPGNTIYPGAQTREKMLTAPAKSREMLESSYFVSSNGEVDSNNAGYVMSVIATRKHEDGTKYFTSVKPLSGQPNACVVEELLTPNVKSVGGV